MWWFTGWSGARSVWWIGWLIRCVWYWCVCVCVRVCFFWLVCVCVCCVFDCASGCWLCLCCVHVLVGRSVVTFDSLCCVLFNVCWLVDWLVVCWLLMPWLFGCALLFDWVVVVLLVVGWLICSKLRSGLFVLIGWLALDCLSLLFVYDGMWSCVLFYCVSVDVGWLIVFGCVFVFAWLWFDIDWLIGWLFGWLVHWWFGCCQ